MSASLPAAGVAGDRAKDEQVSAAWLFEDSADLYVETDQHGRILWANRAWERLLGWTAETLGDRTLDDLTHPEDRGVDLAAAPTWRLRTAHGDWCWVKGSARAFDNGRRAAVLRDCTYELHQEQARQDLDRVREALSEAAGLSRLTLDPVTRDIQFHAPPDRATTGAITCLDDLLARLHPADAADVGRTLEGAMRNGGSGAYDVRVADAHGGWLRYHVTYCTTPRADGCFTVNGLSHDVTGQAMAREAAVESAERLKIALNAARAGVCEMDFTNRTTWCSDEFIEIMGEGVAFPAQAEDPWSMCHPDDRPLVASARRDGLQSEPIEVRAVLPSGATRWVELHGDWRLDDVGDVTKVVYLVLDIDARKRQALELVEAERLAHAAADAKSQFLANMSHEIRTPMNGVLGVLHLLSKEALSSEGRKLLVEAERCGKMLSHLLNDAIDFARIESGRLELSNEPLDAVGLMQGVADLLRPQAVAKGLRLDCRSTDMDAWVLCDPVRLRQALFNLLGNAVKFTSEGRIEMRLSATPSAPNRVRLRFEVEDTGIGIPVAAQESLFQRFIQADGAINRRFGGSGLGLAITQRLAELMGGEVGFTSREGEGSTFWLDIDVDTSVAEAEPPPADEAGGLLAGITILLVEDNPTNRLVASKMLESLGARVETAEDGVEGLKAVQERPYDLVLMDIQMPNMDGIEATHRIRALKGEVANIPIIALTANVMAHQLQVYTAAGMNAATAKPISPAALIEAIVSVFSDSASTSEDSAA